ncbi:hypothetical protein MIZ03_4744 [Rhodoferax lithotrophicus]|uniref:Uncharacterized protein n=1 Tax=Rhodoferax lithotrophicus TaxID=2798804 RepID=A0ABN6DCX9_9BURK|nr:hypothetical protein MIZ03_4744 [Rhodoferax sp. MIZ03]
MQRHEFADAGLLAQFYMKNWPLAQVHQAQEAILFIALR